MSAHRGRAAVFLDRDGVINQNAFNPATQAWESPLRIESVALAKDTVPVLHAIQDAGFLLFIVSNQPNYAKGKASLEQLAEIHEAVMSKLTPAGVRLTACYYCFHHPQGIVPGYSGPCPCRKPSPFFLFRARQEFSIDLARSWMIGDRDTDIQCGQSAGVKTIRLINEHEGPGTQPHQARADFELDSLSAAARLIANIVDVKGEPECPALTI